MSEIEILLTLSSKIKGYMKENKKKLLNQKSEDERKINKIFIANNPAVRDLISRKQRSNKFSSSMSSSVFMTENEEDDYSVPEEKDWKSEIKQLKKKTGDFNINNYSHVLSPEEKVIY